MNRLMFYEGQSHILRGSKKEMMQARCWECLQQCYVFIGLFSEKGRREQRKRGHPIFGEPILQHNRVKTQPQEGLSLNQPLITTLWVAVLVIFNGISEKIDSCLVGVLCKVPLGIIQIQPLCCWGPLESGSDLCFMLCLRLFATLLRSGRSGSPPGPSGTAAS